jgi:hypothetical protein
VPGGWTANGPGAAAVGTLLLNVTGNQAGVSASATETTDVGFDPTNVVKMEVRFGSSGACDNVKYCPSQPKASVASRNGSGVNPDILTTASMPVMGAPWGAYLDCSSYGSGLAMVAVRRSMTANWMSPFGEVLVGGQLVHTSVAPYTGGIGRSASRMSWTVPSDVSLIGLEVHAQGLCQQRSSSPASNKILGNRARLSNALDLTLGF